MHEFYIFRKSKTLGGVSNFLYYWQITKYKHKQVQITKYYYWQPCPCNLKYSETGPLLKQSIFVTYNTVHSGYRSTSQVLTTLGLMQLYPKLASLVRLILLAWICIKIHNYILVYINFIIHNYVWKKNLIDWAQEDKNVIFVGLFTCILSYFIIISIKHKTELSYKISYTIIYQTTIMNKGINYHFNSCPTQSHHA